MAVRIQSLVCPACGHGHTFAMKVGEALSGAYGYTCPETGRREVISPRGRWELVEYHPQGSMELSPIEVPAGVPLP